MPDSKMTVEEMRGPLNPCPVCGTEDTELLCGYCHESIQVIRKDLRAAIEQLARERDTAVVGLRSIEATLGTLDHSEAVDDESNLPEIITRKILQLMRQRVSTKEINDLRAKLAAAEERTKTLETEEKLWEAMRDGFSARASDYEARLAAAEAERWTCFHCGFETKDRAEAESHFGERDDAEEFKPLCKWWQRMDQGERAKAFQDTLQELNSERDENALLRTKIEGLEYRVEGQLSEIHSFKPFRECSTIQQIFHVYDSMEGRALAAEARAKSLEMDKLWLNKKLREVSDDITAWRNE